MKRRRRCCAPIETLNIERERRFEAAKKKFEKILKFPLARFGFCDMMYCVEGVTRLLLSIAKP